jgi:phospholipase A1
MKTSISQITGFFALLLFSCGCFAAQDWLIASRTESIGMGQKLAIEVVRPENAVWPATLELSLTQDGKTHTLQLEPASEADGNRRVYEGRLHQKHLGVVRAELAGQPSNRILLLAADEQGIAPSVASPEVEEATDRPVVVLAQPGDEPALSAYEPSYFTLGSNSEHGKDAKFQLSFKYRFFDPKGSIAQRYPMLSNVYFTYTQTTVWDLGGDSSPFRDTSYKPGVFYRWLGGNSRDWLPDEYHVGLEHESNGQSGNESRSINIGYLRPVWHWDLENGRRLTFYPKIYDYLEKDDNDDINAYRGYVDWQLRYGREDGLIINALYRQGTQGYSTGQLDFSYPLSERIFARTGAFAHLQIFSGYGETLLDYNRENDTQVRLGISLVR